jgi:hypothetical protein
MKVGDVVAILRSAGVRYALIGAHAMAARGYARSTIDVDFLTTDNRVLDPSVWTDLERTGAYVECRRGDADDPLAGVVHIRLADGAEFDLVVGRWKWEAQVVERAEPMRLAGVDMPVARASDLILLKLAAGGYLDLHDAAALLASGDRDTLVGEVEQYLADVRPDVRAVWRELLAAADA